MKVICLSVESVDVVGDKADGLADDDANPHDGVPETAGQGLGDDCPGQLGQHTPEWPKPVHLKRLTDEILVKDSWENKDNELGLQSGDTLSSQWDVYVSEAPV